MKVKCDRCEKEWEYKGKNKYYATCPDCHNAVKLRDLPPQKLHSEELS